MKTKITLLAIAAWAVMQAAAAADQPANQLSISKVIKPSANTVTKPKSLVVTPLNKYLPVQSTVITRDGNISSRSWTETVGWNPGKPSLAYDSGGGKEQGLPLFWIGHEPWR